MPIGRALLSLDRVIAPSFVVKRVTLREVVQDERFTKDTLGVDCDRARHRLLVVLDGETREFVGGKETPVRADEAFFVPAGTDYASRAGNCDLLELEWDPPLGVCSASTEGRLRLSARARGRARDLANVLADASEGQHVATALDAVRDLVSESDVAPPELVAASPVAGDQELMSHVDGMLSQLGTAPMLVDLESSLSTARRTLTRRIRSLHERHALRGRGGGRWRGLRDTYRLVIASILLTHEEATPRRVAGLVGYGSTEALDHAFRNASLESPAALQRAMRLAG